MYSIGLFSKINRITPKTLRHYDKIGLLKPKYIDKINGYRYYSSEQLLLMHKIINLKQMGLCLAEIKEIMDQDIDMELFLLQKENELEKNIKEKELQLMQVRNYKERLKYSEKYTPVVKSLPEVIVAYMRLIVSSYSVFFDILPEMAREMERQGAVCAMPEYCFNIYYDGAYKETNIDVEICEAVVDCCRDSEMVKYRKIEKVEQAICVLHKGPYSNIREAYAFAFNWIENNGYTVAGLPRESYIDGIWNKDSECDWLTEIQVPIR